MADEKLAPSTGAPMRLGASLDDNQATMLESLALIAILSYAIREVRLFERTPDGHRTPRFEGTLPKPPELQSVLKSILASTRSPDPEFPPTLPDRSSAGYYRAAPDANPKFFAQALERLWQSADAGQGRSHTARRFLTAVFDFEPPSDLLFGHSPSAPPTAEPAPTGDATLDLVFDTISRSCHIELPTAPELRGQDLAELRHNAERFPPPEPFAQADLPSDAYLSAAAAAERLGVAKSTVTRRVALNRLIGFRLFTRALKIPKDQFLGADVVPGVPDVLALFTGPLNSPDHKAAWTFLNSRLFHGDDDPRPIDRLRAAAGTSATPALLSELALAKESLDRGDHF